MINNILGKTTAKPQSKTKTIIGTGVGNALEWYDWNVYGTFAIFISANMFDQEDPTSAFLKTMAVFAVGFVARPFGGFLFGWLGDRIGRKQSLSVAVFCASFGSLIIAICPGYATLGAVSSFILLLARLLQGLAHGGELPAAQTYLTEFSPNKSRGFWASAIYVTGVMGNLIGLGLGLYLNYVLSSAQMNNWGWRIPFVFGAVLGLFALWIRNQLDETHAFKKQVLENLAIKKTSVIKETLTHWRVGLQVIGMTIGLTLAYYIWSVTMVSVAKQTWHYDSSIAFKGALIGNFVFLVSLPIWGYLSDIWGRKTNMLISMFGVAILYYPMSIYISSGDLTLFKLASGVSIMLILLAAYLAIAPAVYAEMFPTSIRITGFGIPYSIAIASFGGTAGYVIEATKEIPNFFPIYSIICLVISGLTICFLHETKGIDLSQQEEEIKQIQLKKHSYPKHFL